MFSTSEKLTLASKAVFDAQLASAAALFKAAFDSGITLIDLQLDAVRTSFAAVTVSAKQLLAIRDAREWLSVATSQSRQAIEQAGAYGRQANEFAHDTGARFSQVVETEAALSQQKVNELVDVVKDVPAAAVTPINTFLKTAFDGAQARYDQAEHAVLHAVEAAPAVAVERDRV